MTTTAASPEVSAPKAPAKPEYTVMNNMLFEGVLKIHNPQTLQQFQAQFNSLNAEVQRIITLGQRIEQALTTAEKDALAKVREQEIRDLDAKDTLFQKVYGFKVSGFAGRPTFVRNTKISLLMPVTDEELTKIRADKEFKEEDVVIRDSQKLVKMSTITDEGIPLFERNVNLVQAQLQNLRQLKAAIDQSQGEGKAKLEEQFKKDEETLNKNNEEMFKIYRFSLARSFAVDILEGTFFVALTREEAERVVQQQKAAPAPAAPAAQAAPETKKTDKAKN